MAAANEIGYPVVVKAQVLIGGRGKAGGVKLADDEAQAREHAENILGLDIKGHIVRTLWIEHASDIATEYYASVLLDRSEKKPLVMFSTEGGVDIEEVAENTPDKLIKRNVDALEGLTREEAVEIATDGGADSDVIEGVADALMALYEVWIEEDASPDRDQPADRDAGPRGQGAGREGLAGRQRAVPPPRERRPVRQGEPGPDRAQGVRAGRPVRQARRRHRHPGQRRRAGHVHPGRGGPGRREARQLPGRRRRLGRREGQAGGVADPGQRRRQGRAVQHLRRHHPLRRGGQRAGGRVQGPRARRPVRGAPGRDQRRPGPRDPGAGRPAQRPSRPRPCSRRPRRWWSSPR